MADNFAAGENDINAAGPPITQEVVGARMAISVAHPGPMSPPTQVPYLMPSVAGRNGSMERVQASITHTPLGGLMPGPDAIAPAVVAGNVGAFPCNDNGAFGSGVLDACPEGSPIPIR